MLFDCCLIITWLLSNYCLMLIANDIYVVWLLFYIDWLLFVTDCYSMMIVILYWLLMILFFYWIVVWLLFDIDCSVNDSDYYLLIVNDTDYYLILIFWLLTIWYRLSYCYLILIAKDTDLLSGCCVIGFWYWLLFDY